MPPIIAQLATMPLINYGRGVRSAYNARSGNAHVPGSLGREKLKNLKRRLDLCPPPLVAIIFPECRTPIAVSDGEPCISCSVVLFYWRLIGWPLASCTNRRPFGESCHQVFRVTPVFTVESWHTAHAPVSNGCVVTSGRVDRGWGPAHNGAVFLTVSRACVADSEARRAKCGAPSCRVLKYAPWYADPTGVLLPRSPLGRGGRVGNSAVRAAGRGRHCSSVQQRSFFAGRSIVGAIPHPMCVSL